MVGVEVVVGDGYGRNVDDHDPEQQQQGKFDITNNDNNNII